MVRGRRCVTNTSLLLIYSITAFLVTYVLLSLANMNALQLANSGYISEQAISFDVACDISISADAIQAQLEPGTYLFRKVEGKNEILEFYAIQSGSRFPITSGNQFQLTGSSQQHTQVMQGNASPFELEEGAVIAQLGIDTPSLLDYQTFVYPSCEQRLVLQQGTWICDGSGDVYKSVERLLALLGDSCTTTETTPSGLYRITSMENMFNTILYFVLCCCVLACVPLMNHWVDSCHYEQQCYERMGLPILQQWNCFMKKIAFMAILAWICGSIVAVKALDKPMFTYIPFIALETVIAILCITGVHAVLFLTNTPQYPWSETKV